MIECSPMSARLTPGACQINCRIAEETRQALESGEETLFTLPDYRVNRMLVCSSCPRSTMRDASTSAIFRQGMAQLIDKIDSYNEWGPDPELSRLHSQERERKWREDNAELIRQRGQQRRLNDRIHRLRREYGREDQEDD